MCRGRGEGYDVDEVGYTLSGFFEFAAKTLLLLIIYNNCTIKAGTINRFEIDMESRDILQKIIEENGCCNWALRFDPTNPYYICDRCPMSKLRKRKDSRYLSCYEALGCGERPTTEGTHDALYKKAAECILSDISIEEMLVEEE